jgi:5-methylcytosine-specific restriction endonuclease McrA
VVTRGYCREHASQQRKWNRSVNDPFYGSKSWKMSRRDQLFRFPLCQCKFPDGSECAEMADSVHHIVPIEDGGAKRDPANLMSCCRPHHSAIHAAMGKGRVAS